MFLESSRSKFIGYTLGSDTNTVVGLPRPIHESIRTLKLVSTSTNSSSPCCCVPSPCTDHRSGPVVFC